MARFLVDAQLPPRLARALAGLGHESQHLADVALRHGTDDAVWKYAAQLDAIVVTKDEDFVSRYRREATGPIILWLRIGNTRNARLLSWLLPLMPLVLDRVRAGDRLIEIR